jgi:hypothetical protein
MIFPLIRYYQANALQQPFVFYILSKGDNAGKPSLPLGGVGGGSPWTNSFAVICQNHQYLNFYYWLVYGLFKTGKFKTRHRGSVILFVNINDIRDLIRDLAPTVFPHWAKFQELIKMLEKIESFKSNLGLQIIAAENLELHLLLRCIDGQ